MHSDINLLALKYILQIIEDKSKMKAEKQPSENPCEKIRND